jgi:hypothetical protein
MSLDIPKTIHEEELVENEVCLIKPNNSTKIKTNRKNKISKKSKLEQLNEVKGDNNNNNNIVDNDTDENKIKKPRKRRTKLNKEEENVSNKSKDSSKLSKEEEEELITYEDLSFKEKGYYKTLCRFYGGCTQEELDSIYEILNDKKSKGISLRKFEWFVMRYSFYYKTVFQVNNRFMKDRVYVHMSYKGHQKTYNKVYFDPFKRKNNKSKEKRKFLFDLSEYGKNFCKVTTIPQLHFVRWILTHGIIDYVKENYEEIFKKESEDEVNKYFDEKSERSKKSKNTKSNDNSTTDSKSQGITVNRGVVFAF